MVFLKLNSNVLNFDIHSPIIETIHVFITNLHNTNFKASRTFEKKKKKN